MNPHSLSNRDFWDELVPMHRASEFYDVASFLAGKTSLLPLELREMGDVAGQSLLHLQCHFGMDTLSWARLGARVTGVDYSPAAIRQARELAREAGLDGRFIESAVETLLDHPEWDAAERFDRVYTSYGALCWLPDLRPWAEVIVQSLRPGGTFYMAEVHPYSFSLDRTPEGKMVVSFAYLPQPEPMRWESDDSYATGTAPREHKVTYEWSHGLGEIVTALLNAGLVLEFLHEWPFSCFQALPGMERDADGTWRMTGEERVPFLFSLRARKPLEQH